LFHASAPLAALVAGNVSSAYIDWQERHCKVLAPLTFQFLVKRPW
jgi:hypothetical protein